MPDEVLLLVKRAEGCECPDLGRQGTAILLGWWRPMPGVPGFSWSSCGHGSTVEVMPAQVVACERCRVTIAGCVTWMRLCSYCLGTGLRLAKKDEPCGQPEEARRDG